MNNQTLLDARQDDLITSVYNESRAEVLGYIAKRINSRQDAEDMVQDLYLKLLGYNTLLKEETLLNLIYKIARNLIIDYYRHNKFYIAAHNSFVQSLPIASNITEDIVAANEIERIEQQGISGMSMQRRLVYELRQKDGQSVGEIADQLSLSKRTVENHILSARKEMIAYVSSFY